MPPLPYGTSRWTDDGEHVVLAESGTWIPPQPDPDVTRHIYDQAAAIHKAAREEAQIARDQRVMSWHQYTSTALQVANHN